MNALLGFEISESHYARQLDLTEDRVAVSDLGRRCARYLRRTTEGAFNADDAPRIFLEMFRPGCASTERGVVLGIFRRGDGQEGSLPRLSGVVYLRLSGHAPGTWCILLLLLEPAVRSRGLGSTVHAAFVRWAAARGARRLVVAVSEANRQALRFWRDRLGYTETVSGRARSDADECRRSRELESHIVPVTTVTPRARLRV